MKDLFERASRMKIRFETEKGNIATEDLWDLPLTDLGSGGVYLDGIAQGLHKELKDSAATSFVVKKSQTNETCELKLEIVKRVIDFKLAVIEKNQSEAVRKSELTRIEGIIADKEDDEIKGKSLAELKKMLKKVRNNLA